MDISSAKLFHFREVARRAPPVKKDATSPAEVVQQLKREETLRAERDLPAKRDVRVLAGSDPPPLLPRVSLPIKTELAIAQLRIVELFLLPFPDALASDHR